MEILEPNEYTGAWDYATLPANVRIGEGCYLEYKDIFDSFRSMREAGLVLGRGVRVYYRTEFNVEPSGRVEIGDHSILVGPLIMCAECISIGKRVVLSYNVAVADSDFHPLEPELRKQDAIANAPGGDLSQRPPLISQPVIIEDDVQVGIGAIVLKGVRIGAGAQVGAGAVVTSDVPAGAVVAGNPARVVTEGSG